MARVISEDFRQIRLGLPGVYKDVTEDLDPLTIYVAKIPKSGKLKDVARELDVDDHSVTLKKFRGTDMCHIAFIQPNTWIESDYLLSKNVNTYLHGKKLSIRQAYDEDQSMPGHKHYKIHKLSEEPFDLMPDYAGKPSIHCLNDYVLMHILGYLDLKEKLRIEAVCRRWQALIYSQVGGQSTVDLNAAACPWRSVLTFKEPERTSSVVPVKVNKLHKYKLIMYKMLIMNGANLTALHLDEHRCIIELNIVSAIGRLAPNLEVLSMRFSSRRRHCTSLRNIFVHCSKLRTLCLDGIHSTESLFDDLRCCRALEVLRLNGVGKLGIRGKHKLALKELSLSDVTYIDPQWKHILQPNLKIFRLFTTVECYQSYTHSANFDDEMFATLLKTCPDLTEIQVCYDSAFSHNFQSFKNLKVLRVQIDYFEPMDMLKIDFPPVEELRVEFLDTMLDVQWDDELESFNFSTLLPASVKSFTLPTRSLDKASYESLLALPNLERIFFTSNHFTLALLEKFVSRPQFVEIGAGMLHLNPDDLKALASLRRKALARATKKAATDSPDSARPLVLHLPSWGESKGKFEDPLIKVIELKGESYIYNRVGSTQFDNEWTDFSLDFLRHELGMQCHDEDAFCPDVFLVDNFHRFFDDYSDDEDYNPYNPYGDSSWDSPDDCADNDWDPSDNYFFG